MSKSAFSILFAVLFILNGCSGLKEAVRGFAGLSTKVLEDTRKDAITKDFNTSFDTARITIKTALKDNHSYIYREDSSCNLIAVYASESDTTPVGVFLTSLDKDNTKVEISSPSTYGKEAIAKVVFDALKGINDAKKQ